jgi:tetratricopeptide (TPR) repeat protein
MKKYSLSIIISFAILSTASVSSIIGCKAKAGEEQQSSPLNELAIPPLFERSGELANATEWPKTKAKIDELKQKIALKTDDIKSRLQIVTIYMSEVRITGQASYYYPVILKMVDGILSLDSKNFEATVYKSSVKMSLHQFAEAKEIAEKARVLNPDNAYVYGMLVDANVELGNYKEAIAMSDKMQSLKPSLEAYSRASYLREIFGDYPGAIQAMKMAVGAAVPGTESGEWARVALGDLYLNTGSLDSAEMLYKTSLEVRPSFPNAEIGLAKVEKARKNYKAAISHTENAIRIVSEAPYVSLLGELYMLDGNKEKGVEINNDVVDLLEKGEKEQGSSVAKHNGNRELATAYLNLNKLDKAMEYAQNDLKMRPDNIDANELVAWVAYLKGDYTLAKNCAGKMLATNTMNANMLTKAALIYKKTGDMAKSEMLLAKAKSVSRYTDEKIMREIL